MASIEVLVDDIDGSTEAQYTREFSVDGRFYRIDLSEENSAKFDESLAL